MTARTPAPSDLVQPEILISEIRTGLRSLRH